MFILRAKNTEKAGHTVKPRLPGKMCTLTSFVQSQHAIGIKLCKENKSTKGADASVHVHNTAYYTAALN